MNIMSDVMEPFVYKLGVGVPHDVIFVVVHHSVKILPGRMYFHAFRGRRQLKDVTLPEGLEEIGDGTFYDCVSLERINFPSSLIRIGNYAFRDCHSLKDVTLPEGLKVIGEGLFRNGISLGRINYPSSLIKIGGHAFARCRLLKEVTLPDGFEEIGRRAFIDCVSLERINCPSSLIKIGGHAFAGCHSLTKVTLAGGGVVTIEGDAFGSCPSLDGVTIPPKAFIIEVGHVFTCQLVLTDNGTIPLSDAKQMIVSPEHLNYISSCDLLEIENAITTIMNDQGRTREENIEQVLALIKSRALFEVSTILELALWKINIDKIDDSSPGTRAEYRVTCGSDYIIPGVKSYM